MLFQRIFNAMNIVGSCENYFRFIKMTMKPKENFSNVKSYENQPNFVFPGSDVDTDWDSLENSADFNYGTILIIRPLGLIVTLATAYGLHQFYPNIFCYE